MRRSSRKWLVIYFFSLHILGAFLIVLMRTFYKPIQNDMVKQSWRHKRDWHDYKAMYDDKRRIGPGEQGKNATLSADTDRKLENAMTLKYGYNALLSDVISVNRSVLDTRYKGCFRKKYLAKLPSVSVVIPFNNEVLSVLLRTVHSIINRTPPELLKEIILIDDYSEYEKLGHELDKYVEENFDKVQIIRLPRRMGLIRARMFGIRKATAEVLVMFESHAEANYNWLPPLLEPIVLNKRTVVCPVIDKIDYSSMEYRFTYSGYRGGFDWKLRYFILDVLSQDLVNKTEPYRTPVMLGGLFAITAEFFWELGGYDEGLDIWGGEQFELSFKIWMCGGKLVDAPCSRVGHLYRDPRYVKPNPRGTDYHIKNFKRVAEVWMDEYKTYVYERNADAYNKIDPGDLTAQKALRENLHCKSFKWYLEEVAFDYLKLFPPFYQPHYAYGTIENVGLPNFCIDALSGGSNSKPGLYYCAKNHTIPHENQLFALSSYRDLRLPRNLRLPDYCMCLETRGYHKNAFVYLYHCHSKGGNQHWYYDRKNKWLVNRENYCLEASSSGHELYINICQIGILNMQWRFGVVNDTALDRFF